MTQPIQTLRKSFHYLARTKFGQYINSMFCSHYLYSHFNTVDTYFSKALVHPDKALDRALLKSMQAGLPVMTISASQGKLLQLLTATVQAQRVLEIGTLGGYSAIWMGRGMHKGGRLITLEYNPDYAAVAQENINYAGLSNLIDIRVGKASDSLRRMEKEKVKPFDVIFIDADKNNYPTYLNYALKFSHYGTLIIGDNVVFEEEVLDKKNIDPNIKGIRRFVELLGSNPRISATAIQTVGIKGHDGFSLAVVH